MTDKMEYQTDDERLSAFLDGELPADEADALAERLAREPQLMQRLEALRSADAAAREVYAALGRTPMPESVLQLFEQHDPATQTDNVVAFPARGIRRFFDAPVAIAASIALVAGFLGANLLQQSAESPGRGDAFAAGAVAAGTPLFDLLEATPGGELREISGNAAQVLLTFEAVNGDWCRQLRADAADRSIHGVACRRDGAWQLETIALGAAGAPGGQFSTAARTTPEAVDVAVEVLIGDREPLESDDESSLISAGWDKFPD